MSEFKHKLVIAFGEDISSQINEGEEIDEDNGGCIVEYKFKTKGEREAFLEGVNAMDGWLGFIELNEEQQEKYKELVG